MSYSEPSIQASSGPPSIPASSPPTTSLSSGSARPSSHRDHHDHPLNSSVNLRDLSDIEACSSERGRRRQAFETRHGSGPGSSNTNSVSKLSSEGPLSNSESKLSSEGPLTVSPVGPAAPLGINRNFAVGVPVIP